MIKKEETRNGKKTLILYENEIYIERDDRPNFLMAFFLRENVKRFTTEDVIMKINGLGDKDNNDEINVHDKDKYKITLMRIEDEKEE